MATKTISSGDMVNAPSKKYTEFIHLMKLPNTLLGGTEAMRSAGEEFLPKEDGESDLKYMSRLKRSTLLEGYSRTIEKLVGEMFREPINLSEEITEEVWEYLQDIDREGNDISAFCAEAMEAAIHEGMVHILIDYPPSPGKTKAEHRSAGARPYWVLVKASRVIGWRTTATKNGPILSQVRISETHTQADGKYGEKTVERVRVLEPGKWTVYEEGKGGWQIAKNDDGTPMEGTTSLDKIPLVSIRTGNTMSEMTARPPLLPLAHLNCTHWQSSSDQRNILHYARLVTWFGKMIEEDDDGKVLVGANRLVRSESPAGDLKVVEHSGAAIAAGRQDLEDLKAEMALFGLSMMIGKTGGVTATEKAIDKGESDSALSRWARALNSALETAMALTYRYLNEELKGTAKANDDFSGVLANQDPALIIKAFESGLLSLEAAFAELRVRGIVTQEIDIVDLLAQLEQNRKRTEGLEGLQGAFGEFGSLQI